MEGAWRGALLSQFSLRLPHGDGSDTPLNVTHTHM
jgi:hypothetical protein